MCVIRFLLFFGAFLFSLLYGPNQGISQTYHTEKGQARVKGGNAVSSYVGSSAQLKGKVDLKENELVFELQLETLETGIGLRDEHMYETLETEKHPRARFEGRILGDSPGPGEKDSVTVKGRFTIHGVSKRIEVSGMMDRRGHKMKVAAAFPILITEYGMERPGFSFVSVRDEHRIEIAAELAK